jgi:cytochrome c oxidase subunit 1
MRAVRNGLIGGLAGFALGAGLVAAVRLVLGLSAWEEETSLAVGYLFGLTGWLLGVGVWELWAREWFGLEAGPYQVTGWRRYFHFDTDHKVIGIQYLVMFTGMLLVGGLFAMLIRTELLGPFRFVMDPATYNQVMSLHGMFMIAVAITIIMGPFGNYIMPIMLGADDMAFPRMNALSFWLTPMVPLLLLGSWFFGGWDSGWTGYAPLSITNQSGQLLYNLAFMTLGLSSIVGAVNFLTTVITKRAPGMTWSRLPIFVWSVFATAILSLLATNFIFVALLMATLDRLAGTGFFLPAQGGDPILYQHIFWFYSHPAVYVMAIPGIGVALEVIAHFSRKPLFAYRWAVAGIFGIVILSFTVWAHHMFTTGMPQNRIPFMITTEMISVPTGFVFMSALGTVWEGRLNLKPPMLFALGVIFNFLIGGITGVFLADVPTDYQLQDTFWVVAHFHYTILSAQVFGVLAAIYYWFPKMTGRLIPEWLGRLHFWWIFVSFNATFFPMFWLGLNGMNRRVAQYLPQLTSVNVWVSLSAFLLGASFLFFVFNLAYGWRRGERAGENPWGALTLEWMTASPPPHANFERQPRVVGPPYGYGMPDATHGRLGPPMEASGAEHVA